MFLKPLPHAARGGVCFWLAVTDSSMHSIFRAIRKFKKGGMAEAVDMPGRFSIVL
jgi:hypothetical protein